MLKFIEKNHARICSLHLKDRQYAKTLNVIATDNQIWGEGDTPITEVLRLVRDNSYKFKDPPKRKVPIGNDFYIFRIYISKMLFYIVKCFMNKILGDMSSFIVSLKS